MKQNQRMLGDPGLPSRAETSLKEEFAQKEAELTPEERELFKRRKEELTAQWLLVGGFWGCVLGALIGHFLLDTPWLTGLYTGLPLGLLAGLAAGQIFGGLEKALLLEHIGRYARPETPEAQPEAPADAE